MSRTTFLAIVSLLLASCVTVTLSPEGSQVRLTSNPDVVKGCSYIGFVQGTDHMNGGLAGQGAAEEDAMREIRNNAAKMGANTVNLIVTTTGFSGSAVRGEAYKCS
ncbi:MAG: hypothetical protein JWQ90_4033 [Hydrocarboniphaga sp.]|uniref:DUF4156 domain-containing protein n=1 Tax=Hydrocarboniphaga sp. TaxID=2033016 RepID=UPI00280FD785|nr:hypothetical protein [Hydrocarboniphaga sp.]